MNFCEMLQANLLLLRLPKNLMTALFKIIEGNTCMGAEF